jgi:hypothetical protein
MSIQVENGSTNAQLTITDGAANIKDVTPREAGFAALIAESDPGTVTGTRELRELEASEDFRLRVGVDSILWQDAFNYGTVNARRYRVVTSTMTITQAGGFLNLNAGNSVTTAHSANIRTARTFQIFGSYSLYCQFDAVVVNTSASNAVGEVGLGYAATSTPPTDGAFFRWDINGTLKGVVVNNSVAVETADITLPPDNETHQYVIVVGDKSVHFWIDQVLVGTIDLLVNVSGAGSVQNGEQPFFARVFNNGTATAAKRIQIANLNISLGDANITRSWATTMAGMELGSYQSIPGAAATQTATWANSAAPANATLSNTAAGYTTLGGQFSFAAVVGAETDYALFAFQVPVGSVTQPGKNLIIRNIRIDTFNTGAAVATTAHVLMWALGVGSTAVSLATADSLTAGGCSPVRIPLGVQSMPVGSAIGYKAETIDVNLDAAVYVPNGTFAHIILRMPIATATASQVIRGIVHINGFYE